jgi:hypothetical protein
VSLSESDAISLQNWRSMPFLCSVWSWIVITGAIQLDSTGSPRGLSLPSAYFCLRLYRSFQFQICWKGFALIGERASFHTTGRSFEQSKRRLRKRSRRWHSRRWGWPNSIRSDQPISEALFQSFTRSHIFNRPIPNFTVGDRSARSLPLLLCHSVQLLLLAPSTSFVSAFPEPSMCSENL